MVIGIIGAMEQEVSILRQAMVEVKETKLANCIFYNGKINGLSVILLQSGIGKVAASLGTTLLLQLFKPDMVINTGSAGAIQKGLEIGEVIISNQVCYHDVDVTAFGYQKGQLPNCPPAFIAENKLIIPAEKIAHHLKLKVRVGEICSGDCFVNSASFLAAIKQHFPDAIAVDMEAAAIAQVCYIFDIPFVVIRAISDNGDKNASLSFEQFLPLAAQQSSKIVLSMLPELARF